MPYKPGGHFIAPRTVLKCIFWGSFVQYSSGKIAFSNMIPVGDLGLPIGYKASKAAILSGMDDRKKLKHENLERRWDKALIKRNNNSAEVYENNLFENYFGSQTLTRIESLLNGSSLTGQK